MELGESNIFLISSETPNQSIIVINSKKSRFNQIRLYSEIQPLKVTPVWNWSGKDFLGYSIQVLWTLAREIHYYFDPFYLLFASLYEYIVTQIPSEIYRLAV